MFILVLATILGLMHLYLWKRLVKDTTGPGRTRWMLTGLLVALAVFLVAALVLPRAVGVSGSGWYAWPGYIWFGLATYLFLTLLVTEPVRVLLRGWAKRGTPEPPTGQEPAMNRRVFLARSSAVAAGAVSVGVVGFGVSRALGPPELLQLPMRLRRLDPAFNGFRIAVVSDIHLGPLAGRAHTERIVEMINGAQPDLVAIVGDLVDGTVAELGPAAEPLRDLNSGAGTFFVTGNHEYYVADPESWLRELDRLDVHVLRNENTVIRRGSATFGLAGVNDVAGGQRSDPPDLERALAGLDESGPTILLAHQPVLVTEAAASGVDLQLSGHTHGGQMWPFHYLVRADQPSLAGLSTVADTQLYVTRGAGFWGPPVRVGAPPDITVLSLEAGEK
ncbi:metallophosphoesterase [Mycolicibacterium holsaticum]|uniref:metallophosphoesterase n=1 Tax=Mycolicibacterium holsaticum TaxID=152142 RepID=UPI001C7D1A4E|nr:metallophosphoesterase [Mycolicibacterium holsaticum]MDA4107511.1 metallophosphatase [Mycolicibacterium holsaticum DSM 44478 = JCM 12374]QZA11177.1 metallophosphoesterase [Mycolicibacterium holsaticum DSM 44478 = JCM 12374]UNC11329.1 metallophosphoesterase [Mycolicibacterium holsaticum DSM 44478 = JCM 12374]